MGACVSQHENCVGGDFGVSKKKKKHEKRRKTVRKSDTTHLPDRSLDKVDRVDSSIFHGYTLSLCVCVCYTVFRVLMYNWVVIFIDGVDYFFICFRVGD